MVKIRLMDGSYSSYGFSETAMDKMKGKRTRAVLEVGDHCYVQ